MTNKLLRSAFLSLLVGLLTGCFGKVVVVVTATPSPTPTVNPSATLRSATLTPSPVPVGVWISPGAPPEYRDAFDALVSSGAYGWSDESQAQVKLIEGQTPGGLNSQWIYVPVVAFPTVADNVAWEDIQRFWKGDTAALAALLGDEKLTPEFVASQQSLNLLTTLLGAPAPAVKVELVPPDAVGSTLWKRRPAAWALAPFQALEPNMKALTLDGISVFSRNLDLSKYPLVQKFTLNVDPEFGKVVQDLQNTGKWLATNRDLTKMTVLVMTGTTALSRATAFTMENTGITLPARDIAPFLADADLVHTSNEVSFATDCPFPNPAYTDTTKIRFCSKDNYLDLLKAMHLNIVELTGNHVVDWGYPAFSHTLDVYDANHIAYFGGGRNEEDARKALIVKDNGNIIAFIGCNPVGPAPVWAKPDRVGAAKCDDEFLSKEIPRLKTVANVVIMTIQYDEYYQYNPTDDQVKFFARYAALGADVVFGSQAHVPQGFAFDGHTFIHYGTGNLFFDQMDSILTRQMFADKLIFYNGKLISTVLFTGISEDYSRPRPMTDDERKAFLQAIFKASGW